MTTTQPPPVPTAIALRRAFLDGRLTAADAVRDALERIAVVDPSIHAWETLDREHALAQARSLDAQRGSAVPMGLLAGVPIGVKDIIDTADLPTGCGSPIHRGSRPAHDAQCVTLARDAGAVVMGKTVTTELAYFQPGPTTNPWNRVHTPGGSSSGSAAAVAAGMVPLAFGTQTAGSIVRPASFCGVFGLKPTFGAFGMAGIHPFSPSLDTLGWFARCADDLELMRCALSQSEFRVLDVPAPAALRLAVCRTHEEPMLDAGGAQAWGRAQRLLRAGGIPASDVEMPASLAGLLEAQKTVMAYEAWGSLAQEREHSPGLLSQPIHALFEIARAIGDDEYQRAKQLAQSARAQIRDLMRGLDALLVPSATGEAPVGLAATGDPVFCRVWTLLGLPCVNVPGLRGPSGLPIGVQLVGHAGDERALLAAAACVRGVIASSAGEPPDDIALPE